MGTRQRRPSFHELAANHAANSLGAARDFDPANPRIIQPGEKDNVRSNREQRQPATQSPQRRQQPQTRQPQERERQERQEDPGWGSLFRRETEPGRNQPQYTGQVLNPDGDELQVAIWIKTARSGQKYLRIHLEPPYEPDGDDLDGDQLEDDDDIPF